MFQLYINKSKNNIVSIIGLKKKKAPSPIQCDVDYI